MVERKSGKRIIGLGGGIGAGKSVVARILRLNSVPVYDCDTEAKRLMETDISLRSRIVGILGESAYSQSTGCLDRGFVASCIFSDTSARERVNKAVHAAVAEDFIRFAETCSSATVVCESAILKSSGLYAVCNEIWITEAPDEVRVERVKLRNGLSEEEIMKRILAQRNETGSFPGRFVRQIRNDGVSPVLSFVCGLLYGENNVKIESLEL